MTKHYNGWTIVLGVLCLFLLCWVGLICYFGMPYGNIGSAGTFGDQFGAVNALFSALALAGVIYTLIQQQQEMREQRREFMVNRTMSSVYKQLELLDNSVKTLHVSQMRFNGQDYREWKGYEVIDKWVKELKGEDLQWNIDTLESSLTSLNYFLRIFANSCKMLSRIREVEDMNDADSLLMFETFRYNIDLVLWEFIRQLENIDRDSISQDGFNTIKYYRDKIVDFRSTAINLDKKIKKDTDDIDGK